MRELFDEAAGQSAADPLEAARRSARAPQRRRFYASAAIAEAEGGFAIVLDGKPIKTPAGRQVIVPVRSIAQAVADEWNAQGEMIDPLSMPATRLANSVVQGVVDHFDAVAEDIVKYLGTDLLFYRASHPEALVKREAEHWDPVLRWAAGSLHAHFMLSEGIVHVRQPDTALAAARATLPSDPWAIAALHVITSLTGSALIALALFHGVISEEKAWAAAHVDEDWNAEKWGVDEELAARRAARLVDFKAAAAILNALKTDVG